MDIAASVVPDPALEELHDAMARVSAQIHVIHLAVTGMGDERDIRAVISSLDAISEELREAEKLVKR